MHLELSKLGHTHVKPTKDKNMSIKTTKDICLHMFADFFFFFFSLFRFIVSFHPSNEMRPQLHFFLFPWNGFYYKYVQILHSITCWCKNYNFVHVQIWKCKEMRREKIERERKNEEEKKTHKIYFKSKN